MFEKPLSKIDKLLIGLFNVLVMVIGVFLIKEKDAKNRIPPATEFNQNETLPQIESASISNPSSPPDLSSPLPSPSSSPLPSLSPTPTPAVASPSSSPKPTKSPSPTPATTIKPIPSPTPDPTPKPTKKPDSKTKTS